MADQIHLWTGPYGPIKWPHCKRCGVIKQRNGSNEFNACRGWLKIRPRSDALRTKEADNG